MIDFCDRLLALRERKNISQSEMARKLGVARQTYLNMESGDMYPRIDTVNAIAKILNCSPSYLAFGDSVTLSKDQQKRLASIKRMIGNLNLE